MIGALLAYLVDGAMVLELEEVMDYLHFTVELVVGEQNPQTVRTILDTASGSLMTWHYRPWLNDTTFTCGCPGAGNTCDSSAPEDTCSKYDYCSWTDSKCHNYRDTVVFACDTERLEWSVKYSGKDNMRFGSDVRGVFREADLVSVGFKDYVKSDFPIHKKNQIMQYSDGVLGLSYSYQSVGQDTSFWQMYGGSPDTFALDLNRNCGENLDLKCEMHIDTIDTVRYSNIEYSQDENKAFKYGEETVFHEFRLYDLLMCNTKLFDDDTPFLDTLVDTGSSCLGLPVQVFQPLTQLLSEHMQCHSMKPGRPKTCFISSNKLQFLPPLRFRLSPNSNRWHNLRLESLLFADITDVENGSVKNLELCLQETDFAGIQFGTMAILNFYTVFDLKNKRVGLHTKSGNKYMKTSGNVETEISCNYGSAGQPRPKTLCETDSRFCTGDDTGGSGKNSDDEPSGGGSNAAMFLLKFLAALSVLAVAGLAVYLYRSRMWLSTRRSLGYQGMLDGMLDQEERAEDGMGPLPHAA